MVSKKLSKNKAPVTNNRISHSRKRKKAIFVSQNVIINSIFDKSLIDTTKQVILPENLSSIYHEMISDSTFINDTLNKKDYSFYGCNLGFTDGEKMISSKRKALVEFMLKEKTMHRKSKKKIDKRNDENIDKRKIKVKKVKKESEVKIEDKVEIDVNEKTIEKEVVSEEKDSELSSENNNNGIRPQRKRKKPSKFKNEDLLKKRKDNSPKEKSKSVDNDKEKGKENIKTIENSEETIIKPIGKDLKIKKNIRVKKDDSLEVIDLIEDNSSDNSSEKSKHKSNNFNTTSTNPNNKSKIYFREPVSRKPTKLLHKRLKEHTLLDKILLGINCVRKWTEKGLHLSRLYETDLALLNKRLTSLNCILTDLQEHTDENNNRYLSVLLKSELFSSFVLPSQPQKSTDYSIQEQSTLVSTVNSSNEVQENTENVSYNRPKTKQHVPSLYRQRHGLPGILSKPQMKPTENKILFNDSSLISTKNDDNAFSHVKFEESSSNSTNTLATTTPTTTTTIPSDLTNEPQMTASQLLKIKSQKSVTDANQKRTQQLVSEPSLINNTSGTSLPRFTLVTNSIVSDKNQTFYYQTSNLHPRPQFPMYLLSNKTLVSSAPNTGIQRQVCVPIANAFHSVTRIPLQKNNTFPKYPQSFIQPKLSQIPAKNNSLPSKSVVLKNLLQQTNSQIISNSSNTITTNQMVPLSVFQNSQIKRQFLPINQSTFNNK